MSETPEPAPEAGKPEPAIADVALKGLCPRCGAPTLFKDIFGAFAPTCRACGLDLSKFNVGDGPAAFLILILGAVIVAAAIVIQLKFAPPIWLQIVLWIPVTAAAVVWSLRIAKAALLASEYRNKAREGRIAPSDRP
ncbi:DUF983 domain-containing protein [Sphingomonas immobilis]|uniref:DUF983 domain-containing protein n=1 Tax=Sphingomonas immobilis TaxID=3063997 RepID=A0ABT9A2C5_9SPHN|nr:DUF983 domain-containing protein [Sphingomonas sp. CA1-15]MDO7843976.1 DUF983 domain-containing protein [Sphingomonas sp. CA1-15]